MSLSAIVAELRHERDRIDAAITALESNGTRKVGRPRGRTRHMSAAARKRISNAMKKRWASGQMKGNRKPGR